MTELVNKNHIIIGSTTHFLRDQSLIAQSRFAFSYQISIRNVGRIAARLLSRHWYITDANGHVQEVHGEGVVGKKPLIYPGQSYQYTSAALLKTPVGSMHGSYRMINDEGEYFNAVIPAFRLAVPELVN